MTNIPLPAIMGRLCLAAALTLAWLNLPRFSFTPRLAYGPVIHEEASDFSRIRVRQKGQTRHLLFVSDSGREGLQSSLDLDNPGELQLPYSRWIFSTLLFKNPQKQVLIIGLGGGGMVRFIETHLPETRVDVVEIDPAVVAIAGTYFGVSSKPGINLITEDAFTFIPKAETRYDVIYMDAFLRPSVDRDASGLTARLKTEAFLEQLQQLLTPGGLIACNLVQNRKATSGDLIAIDHTFADVLSCKVPGSGNLLVIAGDKIVQKGGNNWISRAEALEKNHSSGLPFITFARALKPVNAPR